MEVECRVLFHSQPICSGSTLKGSVLVRPAGPISLNDISIEVKGKARWWLPNNVRRRKVEKTKIFLLDTCKVLVEVSSDATMYNFVSYTLPFEYHLPLILPSSYGSEHAEISYSVQVLLLRELSTAWGSSEYTWKRLAKEVFPLEGGKDISLLKRSPIVVSESAFLKFFSFETYDIIRFGFRMESQELVAARPVPFTCYVDNKSMRRVVQIRVKLILNRTLATECGQSYRKSRKVMSEAINSDGVAPLSCSMWPQGILPVPENLPPTNSVSLIITFEYIVEIQVCLKGLGWRTISHIIPVVVAPKSHL